MSTSNGFAEYRVDRKSPMIVAHRGASGKAPENTLASFSLALDLGADAVELDIQQTGDGKLVVMHDESLDRTTDGSGMVIEKSYAKIRGLDAGSWFSEDYAAEKVPLLEEALAAISPRGYALVEIKHGGDIYPEIEQHIVDTMSARKDWKARTVFIAFDPSVLQLIRQLDDTLATGLLTADTPEDYIDVAEEFGIQCFLPRWERMRDGSVAALHAAGYSVHPWVMDSEEDARKVAGMGPDSLSSNHPDMLKRVLGRN